ncbi:uroporphyrinogen-III synthase, partial [Streptomyces caeruleatus]
LEPFIIELETASHLLVTSQTSVNLLFELMDHFQVTEKILERIRIICIGQKTAQTLQYRGGYPAYIAQEESQEGVIKLLDKVVFNN